MSIIDFDEQREEKEKNELSVDGENVRHQFLKSSEKQENRHSLLM